MIQKPFKPVINITWNNVFKEIDKDIYDIAEESYNEVMLNNKNIVFPIYKNIFNFTNYLIPDDIKVVIVGQDPYHSVYQDKNNSYFPQAMGLAFSVPNDSPIPPSLLNIYNNLLKFKHINYIPKNGNLEFWAYQGVLLLNSSLSVLKSKANSHQSIWSIFTDELISIISKKYNNLIFVLWGRDAFLKYSCNIIKNQDKHKFIISSHPSPFSAHTKFREYDSFMDTDHFGLINKYLKENNKDIINWKIA
jgi:uracil-DNA glycosylase